MTITADMIAAFESEQPKFTAHERAAIDRYNLALQGCEWPLDVTADEFRMHATEHSHDDALTYARQHLDQFTAWWQAIDTLHSELFGQHGPHASSRRLVEHEANRYFHWLNAVRREVCTWLIGTAGPSPVDAGWAMLSNFPFVQLDGTTAA